MTEFEALSLACAAAGAVTGAVSLVISWRTSMRQTELAMQSHHFAVSKAAAEHHDKYAELLQDVRMKTADARTEIANAASEALAGIYAVVDVPENRSGPRRTDHLIGEACDLTCRSIGRELLFQHGAHLRWRLNGFRHQDWDLNVQAPVERSLHRLRSALQSVFSPRATGAMRPEYDLWRTDSFGDLMRSIAQDISYLEQNALKRQIAENIAKYQAKLDANRQCLQEACKQLEVIFDHNDLERFSLGEMSPKLSRSISQEATQLETIDHLDLPEHESFCKYAVPDLHTWIVYFCLILSLAATNESWQYIVD